MPKVLTVDDSRPVRLIVAKQMKELGLEVEEAEDGQQALARLEQQKCDLIILDVTMPVMDGPTMLAQLRARGDKTPVIMLTSESKRSIVSDALKLGISDYVLKPFQPGELQSKVRTALKLPAGPPVEPKPAAAPSADAVSASAAAATGPQSLDVLLIDDMENVAKRLRALLPPRLTFGSATTAPAALSACRENSYRVILVDTTMPDADSSVLAGQIKMLQKDATIVALTLKSSNNVEKELAAQGFQGVLFKPFAPEAVEDFVGKYFDAQVLLTCSDELLKVGPLVGNPERAERYFTRLSTLFPPAIEQVAAACFENTIVDLSEAPIQDGGRLAKLLADVNRKATGLGLQVRIVGNPELKKVLDGFEETGRIPIFASVQEARA